MFTCSDVIKGVEGTCPSIDILPPITITNAIFYFVAIYHYTFSSNETKDVYKLTTISDYYSVARKAKATVANGACHEVHAHTVTVFDYVHRGTIGKTYHPKVETIKVKNCYSSYVII